MFDEIFLYQLARDAEKEFSRLVDSCSVAGQADLSRIRNVRFTIDHSTIYSERMQLPSVRRYPGLEAKPYWDINDFPSDCSSLLAEFQENSPIFLEEYRSNVQRVANDSTPGVTKYFGASDKWRHYTLVRQNGSMVEDAFQLFPAFANVLQALCDMRYLRKVFFAVMEPGVHLEEHCGGVNSALRMHFALEIPVGDTAIRVGGIEKRWHEGKSLFFDDSFVHSAWNKCDTRKVVLLMRIFHPGLSYEERVAIMEVDRLFARTPVGMAVKRFLDSAPNRNAIHS